MAKPAAPIDDLEALHSALSDFVKLYQFRNRDDRLPHGVTVAQAYGLRALWLGGALSMSELARALTVSVSTLTGVVDQLERKQLVQRVIDPQDRRSFRVELTVKGRKLYEESNDAFRSRLRKVARRYTAKELSTVRTFLGDIGEMVLEWRAGAAS